jgi:hypothetical protein
MNMAKRAGKRVATRKAYRKAKKQNTRAAAKKTRKKASKKASKKTGSKTTRKAGRKTTRRSSRSLSPSPINTGRGPTPAEIGAAVVEAFNDHRPDIQLWDQFWSDDVESIEGIGVSLAWRGRDAMQAKGENWMAEHTIHSASADGPFVGATGFAIRFHMDVEEKSTGNRVLMEEIGVYSVRNGRVVREEFMYGTMTPVAVGGEGEEVITTARVEEVIPI